jgi:hypothetical protein
MIATITNHVSKGLVNQTNPAYKMTFFKTNFNMPTPNVFYGSSFIRYQSNANCIDEGTSYDLTGFSPGFEICVGLSVWDWDNNSGSPYNINTLLYQRWTDPAVSTTLVQGLWDFSYVYTVGAGFYVSLWAAITIGVADWEVSYDDTYHYRASSTGTPAISTVDTGVDFTNVPDTTQLGTDAEGYIWVEGNDLCYVCANQWKQTVVGVDVSSIFGTPGVSKAGYLWMGEAPYIALFWVGADGNLYIPSWEKKQFASYFSNSSTSEINAGTSKAGYLWMDSEFGLTHIGYIASDGYKYLMGSGNDPYA